MTEPERRMPWVRLCAECYWTALHGLPLVRPELKPLVVEHIKRLRRLLDESKRRAA